MQVAPVKTLVCPLVWLLTSADTASRPTADYVEGLDLTRIG